MATFFSGYGFKSLLVQKRRFYVHSFCFIRNAYTERFWGLVKIFEKIRNRLLIFLKIKEQESSDIFQNVVSLI